MKSFGATATAESRDKSRAGSSRAKQSGYPWTLWKILQPAERLLRRQIARQSMGRRGPARAAPVDIGFGAWPPPLRGGPRLYKLFLLSPWVLFRLLIYRLPLITGLRLYSFRRRDEPIAHRLDANSVPLFLRRSHTFSAAPATIIIFPLLSPPPSPLPPRLPLYISPSHLSALGRRE